MIKTIMTPMTMTTMLTITITGLKRARRKAGTIMRMLKAITVGTHPSQQLSPTSH
jgi:hypothetical protein